MREGGHIVKVITYSDIITGQHNYQNGLPRDGLIRIRKSIITLYGGNKKQRILIIRRRNRVFCSRAERVAVFPGFELLWSYCKTGGKRK